RSGTRAYRSRDRLEQGRFARAVGPDDRDKLTFGNVEREPAQRGEPAVADRKVVHRQHYCAHHPHSPRRAGVAQPVATGQTPSDRQQKTNDSRGALRLSSRPEETDEYCADIPLMPFSSVDFLQALSAGILVGGTYALMCVGLGIIFGSMRVINFAQGDFLMVGMYAAFYLTTGFGILTFLGPNAGPIVFGSTPTGIRTPLSRSSWEIGDILLNQGRCVSFVVAVAAAAAVYLFLGHTRLGKGLRAAADNSQAAIYMGIDVDRAHRVAWSLGVGITAVAGGLV